MIPDAEMVLGDYLRTHPDVEALEARVAGKTPTTFTLPWVRVTQLDAIDKTGNEHLIDFLVQFDCYAGSVEDGAQGEASLLRRTVRAALKAAQGQTLDGVVISDVTVTGDVHLPDTTLEPARERYVLSVTVHAHA